MNDLETMLRDSIQMENCKTYRELEYVCRNIEARHRVEGIGEHDRRTYEAEKDKHTTRVLRAVAV